MLTGVAHTHTHTHTHAHARYIFVGGGSDGHSTRCSYTRPLSRSLSHTLAPCVLLLSPLSPSLLLLSLLSPLSSLCNRTLIRVETHSTGDGPEERQCARGAAATAIRHAQANGTDSD